jgi:hypothetical protein
MHKYNRARLSRHQTSSLAEPSPAGLGMSPSLTYAGLPAACGSDVGRFAGVSAGA